MCCKCSLAQNLGCSLQASSARQMASARNTLEPGEIQCQKQSLDMALRETQRLLRQKKRQQIRSSAMPAFAWRVTLMLYVLQDWHAAAAVRYLRTKINRPEDEEELTGQVETWFLQASLEDICALSPPHQGKDVAAFSAAQAWMHEFQLYTWLGQQNTAKGVAPMSAVVLREHQQSGTSVEPAAVRMPGGHDAGPRSNYQWLRRWRRRWGVSIGRFAAREHLQTSVMQNKDKQRNDISPGTRLPKIGVAAKLHPEHKGFHFPDPKTGPLPSNVASA